MNQHKLLLRPALTAFLLVSVLCLSGLSGCQFSDARVVRGSGDITTISHTIGFFSNIELSGAYSVTLSQGKDAMLTIETDDNLHELIDINLVDETLTIVSDRENVLRPTRMDLFIVYPEISKISLKGAGKVSATDTLVTGKLFLEMSGAADIHLDVKTELLHTRIAGAGNISLRGKATNHQVELSGASNLRAEELICEVTHISLSGAGSASVYASERLEASLSGVGKITYYGDPKQKNINKSGLGSISSAR